MRRELLIYAAVFVALLALLALSLATSGIAVSLLIAGAKIALIAFFFMKLRDEDALGWAFASAALVLGALGTTLMLADFLTRS
jgi:hypothetical protein